MEFSDFELFMIFSTWFVCYFILLFFVFLFCKRLGG